jgi:hypothetical protein
MKTILLIFVLALTAQAQSVKEGKAITDWTPLTEDVDTRSNTPYKVFYSSIRRGDDYTKTWLRADFPQGSRAVFPSWRGPEIGSIRLWIKLRCFQHSGNAETVIVYDMSGKMVAADTIGEEATENKNTLGQFIMDAFCEREPQILSGPPRLKP